MIPHQSFGDIMTAAFGCSSSIDLEWSILDWLSDATASHYRLHRDDVNDALFDLEVEYAERHNEFNFGPLLETPWGLSTIAAAVAERVTGAEVTAPRLHLSLH